jgi:uncharacterized protein YfaA (DUF2138 family)
MKQSRRRLWKVIGVVGVVVVGVSLGAFAMRSWALFDGRVNRLDLDLAKPDGLIVTGSLAKLPRDLLRVPLLKDLLSEDFVFYYERGEDRLGLVGSLRRIAYEHELQWQDRLLDEVFDEPADVAFWRNAKGSAEYTLVAMTRNSLAKLVQQAANLALKDSQLKLATTIRAGSDDVPVYALSYGRERTLLLIAKGDRVVALSDPGMLLTSANRADPDAAAIVASLLDDKDEGQQLYRRAYALPAAAADHRVALSANFLSFGYQNFFPGLQALRFDFGQGAWSTHVRLATGETVATLLPASNTSRAVPARPAACSWLPIAWPKADALVARAKNPPVLPRFAGPAVACWYAGSELQAPIFAAELASEPDATTDQTLKAMFAWAIVGEAVANEANEAKEKAPAGEVAIPVLQRRNEATKYQPTLGRRGKLVVFSPDADLAQRALDTLHRRYPSLADTLPTDGGTATLAVLTPSAVGDLAQQAIFDVLPVGEQRVLHDAAKTHLPQRLDALTKYPAYRLTLQRQGAAPDNWHQVRWDTLTARP